MPRFLSVCLLSVVPITAPFFYNHLDNGLAIDCSELRIGEMPTAVSTVTGEEVQYLIAKLDRATPFLPVSSPLDLPLQDFSLPDASTQHHAPPKHLKQVESLGNHLQAANLCHTGTTFCELGCGTAKLSDHVCQMMNGACSHVLIDRKAFGSKTRLRDGSIAATAQSMKRITMDIADIDDLSSTCGARVVVISKHLCGPAADLSIQCCAPISPMAVATCCHYLCKWDSFCNTGFFEELGFSERDFEVLTIVSQWASMGKPSKEVQSQSPSLTHSDVGWVQPSSFASLPVEIQLENLVDSKEFERSFPRTKKAELGKRCKLFLDLARAYRLHKLGYRVKLVRYTTMSLEDHLLLAKPKNYEPQVVL